ncbi:MAG: ABC transporter permease subunit [Rhodospirillales bacterium]|nr:ABC transporter permease subunit [Rhodospirillales bacterium]MBT4040916.1 ABC transporter permease subunit [Rhodospirillales bacterium]MBT4625775.1 ABC transporter permease subunit [Rhodospirillales bacterium]MBT5352855.1 ABC transporter permease subunit [Rhodospirillales bacterium]MBT5521737.1 ABC transporter permease subunit [Rhodospirillales bacterium]
MTAASITAQGSRIRLSPWLMAWIAVLAATVALYYVKDSVPWAFKYPKSLIIPFSVWLNDLMKWLMNSADLGLFSFKEFTRFLSWIIEQPYHVVRSFLSTGFLSGQGSYAVEVFPRVSWIAMIVGVVLLGRYAKDWKLAALVGGCFIYLAIFDQWDSAMVTLSSIAIAVPFGVVGGLMLGIAGFRSKKFETILIPILDLMQTVPVFAYLVPILIMFGFSPVSAMIATIIYAIAPMVRVTMLALQQVPAEVIEAGRMAGCTERQLLWKVQLPSATHTLMVGVNQVVMLSLNMVIIASMIGAGGLGFDVLTALKRLRIGEGIEAGLAITVLAIAMDRVSQALARRPPPVHGAKVGNWYERHPYTLIVLATIIVTWALGLFMPVMDTIPDSIKLSTGTFWGDLVKYININYFDQLDAVKNFLLLNLMIPFKRFLLSLPWVGVVVMIALAGYQLGGARLAWLTGGLTISLAVVGLWAKAMVTVYLCGISVLLVCLIGIPIGVLSARNERLHRAVGVTIDTLQTLPSFVYLMPVVMLFRVGDFAAMLAVIAYAIVPVIRYTDHGIRNVPPHLIEAATQAGCTRLQMLWKVQMPIAIPEIMLGINQTIMMALAMLVITALVGTRELGQEVYMALARAETGRGLVAGICVAFIAIIADRLIGAWAKRRKQELGLE